MIQETATTRHPILVHGAHHNAVLLPEPDRHNITETLRRLSTAPAAHPLPEEAEEFPAD